MRLPVAAVIATLAIVAFVACSDSSASVMDAEASAETGIDAPVEAGASGDASMSNDSSDSAAVADSAAAEVGPGRAHCCVLGASVAGTRGPTDGAPGDATTSNTPAGSDPTEAGGANAGACGVAGMPLGGQVSEPCLNGNAAGSYGRWTCSSGSCANNGLSCSVGDKCTLVDVQCTGVVQDCDYPWGG